MASKLIFIFLFIFLSPQLQFLSEAQNWVQAGYWISNAEMPKKDINSALFTHLLCGFADVNSSTYQLFVPSASEPYFSNFSIIVKRKNPFVKTLMSVLIAAGNSVSDENVNGSVLSSMVSDSTKRKSFVDSSIKTARRYGFDGIDFIWRSSNSGNLAQMGILLDEWRIAINSEPRQPGESKLILTINVLYLPTIEMGIPYPIDSIHRNVDWAQIRSYDYHLPTGDNFTGLHAALYDPSSDVNTDFGIREWLNRGFPPDKLVLGLPYHGWAWRLVSPQDNAIGAPSSGPAVTMDGSMGYKHIKSFIRDYGYGAASEYNATYVVNLYWYKNVWINFDDVETVKVKIAYAKEKGLAGYCAFQLSNDDNWALSRAAAQEGDNQENKHQLLLKIILPVSAVLVILVAVAVFVLYYFRRRKPKSEEEMVLRSIGSPRIETSAAENFGSDAHLLVFKFAYIKAATNNFDSETKLGEGGYGPVYKGKLPRGQEIAVKRLSASSSQGLVEFQNEVSLTARLQHVNLVRLLGYCTEKEEKMLIYEYMPNKSLDLYLFDPIKRYRLDWPRRMRIIEGITQGLLYLQEYSNITVIHRDLKASNILLDDELNPKISDFGMARLFKKDVYEANTGRIVGTYGYVPPEYVTKGIYSMKYDVYSFGVLLLQIISGKRNACYYGHDENLTLLEYAYELWIDDRGAEFIDSSLDDSSSPCKIMRCMQIALLCVQKDPDDRPSMLKVFTMLKTDSMDVATPKRPAFSVKAGKNTGSTPEQKLCSFNDPQISELEPR